MAALVTSERVASQELAAKQGCSGNPWTDCDGFRMNSTYCRELNFESNGNKYNIQLRYIDLDYEIKINDSEWKTLTIKIVKDPRPNRFTLRINLSGIESTFSAVINENFIDIFNEVSVSLQASF